VQRADLTDPSSNQVLPLLPAACLQATGVFSLLPLIYATITGCARRHLCSVSQLPPRPRRLPLQTAALHSGLAPLAWHAPACPTCSSI
jgi:hypothetical protein